MKEFEHLRVRLKFVKYATNNFSDGNFIAEGGFGKVYKGLFFNFKGLTLGAVKRLDRTKDQADVSFWREIMLLSTYRHKNLISLLGFCDESEERILVYEYAAYKSLDFHLLDPNITWIQRLKICLGAACGLEYLHDPKGTQQRVLHRDIKSANILLDKNWNAKIADFGLCKYGPANQKHTFLFSDAKGTLGYCDPIYIESMLLTKESDVYSFGVVLFEVLCSRLCVDYSYNDERRSLPLLVKKCQQEQTLHTIIDANLRTQIEQNSFDTFVTLAYQCLKRDRTQRPSMDMVVMKLKTALEYQVPSQLPPRPPLSKNSNVSPPHSPSRASSKSHNVRPPPPSASNVGSSASSNWKIKPIYLDMLEKQRKSSEYFDRSTVGSLSSYKGEIKPFYQDFLERQRKSSEYFDRSTVGSLSSYKGEIKPFYQDFLERQRKSSEYFDQHFN